MGTSKTCSTHDTIFWLNNQNLGGRWEISTKKHRKEIRYGGIIWLRVENPVKGFMKTAMKLRTGVCKFCKIVGTTSNC